MASLTVGSKAPDFELPTDTGVPFRLKDHKGKYVVLFFYPEDNTAGCTIENQEFSALAGEFHKLGIAVLGVSPDTIETHCRFRDKHRLTIPLAADAGHKVTGKYGAWGPKKMFGHEYDGVIRTTFLIAPDGKVASIWKVTRIKGHARIVFDAATALAAG